MYRYKSDKNMQDLYTKNYKPLLRKTKHTNHKRSTSLQIKIQYGYDVRSPRIDL